MYLFFKFVRWEKEKKEILTFLKIDSDNGSS